MAHAYWPLFDLAVRTPRLELRYPDDDLVFALVALSAKGIHDPGFMPFGVPWTDQPSPLLERNSSQHYWMNRANHKPNEWHVGFAVLVDGEPVGTQGMHATDFAVTRTAGTGSWLGKDHQGKGIGKEMRAGILHLLFAGLDARRCESGAWHDNAPSLGVSRALGYEENGDEVAPRRGVADRQIRLVLDRATWEATRRDDIEIVGLDGCKEFFVATE